MLNIALHAILRTLKKGIIPTILILAIWGVSSSVWALTYHVSPEGDDLAGDGSQGKPWATLSTACRQVSAAGDMIYVNPGSYTDNDSCNLKRGVKIKGAGRDLVNITTANSFYIDANSGVPVTDGNNEISDISFYGTGSNKCIYSSGRSNQEIHDCYFQDFGRAIEVLGKYPVYEGNCYSAPSESCVYCDNDARMSTQPLASDWAENIEIYNNEIKDAKIVFHTIKKANIHHNTIDNSRSLKSGVGYTAYWWNGVEFHDNIIRMGTISWGSIALEVWMVEGNCKFYSNWTNGWFSIIKNPNGPNTPYSWQIVNNTFESNVPPGLGGEPNACALETCYFVDNVLVEGNAFINSDSNRTYKWAIAIWGYGINRNFTIRNNIICNMGTDGIYISSTDARAQLFDGDNINIYNNIFDDMNNSSGQGVAIIDGEGDIDGVRIKNNAFLAVDHGVLIYPDRHSVSGVEFTHNVVFNGKGFAYPLNSGAFTVVSNNYVFEPAFRKTGNRPDPYYRAANKDANIIDKGVEVGILFSGSAPDVGAYEFAIDTPSPPANLRILQ